MPGCGCLRRPPSAVGGRLMATGGRVLTVCATGVDLRAARDAAYAGVAAIDWPEGFCRHDIGWRALGGWRGVTRSGRRAPGSIRYGDTFR